MIRADDYEYVRMEPTLKKAIRREENNELSRTIHELRRKLQSLGYMFGALFVGRRLSNGGTEFGLLLVEDMPQDLRMELLADLQKALDATKQSYQQ